MERAHPPSPQPPPCPPGVPSVDAASPQGTLVVRPDGRIVQSDVPVARILGASPGELQGERLGRWVLGDEGTLSRLLSRVAARGVRRRGRAPGDVGPTVWSTVEVRADPGPTRRCLLLLRPREDGLIAIRFEGVS